MSHALVDQLVEHILAARIDAATEVVSGWARQHGYMKAVTELLDPALTRIGESWSRPEGLSLAQGYVAGRLAEDVMTRAAEQEREKSPGQAPKGTIVLGCIEDDYHMLGIRLVGTFLRTGGWEVQDLGADVLAEEFVDKALDVGAKVVGASAMMYSTAQNIRTLREEIDRRGLTGRIQLAVGGAVFVLRPELVKEVGGDGTAANAFAAAALMDELWTRALASGGAPS
jgi:methanogenic corrinoid protein MtbC1